MALASNINQYYTTISIKNKSVLFIWSHTNKSPSLKAVPPCYCSFNKSFYPLKPSSMSSYGLGESREDLDSGRIWTVGGFGQWASRMNGSCHNRNATSRESPLISPSFQPYLWRSYFIV